MKGKPSGSYSTMVAGKLGNAINFSGNGVDFVELYEPEEPMNDMSISLWVYPLNLGGVWIDANYHYGTAEYGYRLSSNLTGGIQWAFGDGATNTNWILSSVGLVKTNQWNHIVMSKQGVTSSIYINGKYDNAKTNTVSAIRHSGVDGVRYKYLGVCVDDACATAPFTSNTYFNGSLDEIAIWNKSLSAEEVAIIYLQQAHNYVYTANINTTNYIATSSAILSGQQANVSSIALNGSALYAGTYGVSGAISKLDLSTNKNIANWSQDSTNVSLASNKTLALSYLWRNATTDYLLAGSLGGMSLLEFYTAQGGVADTCSNTAGVILCSDNCRQISSKTLTGDLYLTGSGFYGVGADLIKASYKIAKNNTCALYMFNGGRIY